jgi:hypothetical protein
MELVEYPGSFVKDEVKSSPASTHNSYPVIASPPSEALLDTTILRVRLLKVKKYGAFGALGTVAASTVETAENGPHPTKFLALYMNLYDRPLVMF